MNQQDNVVMRGSLKVELFDQDGRLKEQRDIHNLVVTAGKTWIAGRMVGVPAVMSHMAVGSGTVDPVIGDTALGTELGRVALGSSTSSGAVVTYAATFPAGTGTGAVTEAGILNAATAGTLLCRTEFPVVNKGANDGMTITWTVTVS